MWSRNRISRTLMVAHNLAGRNVDGVGRWAILCEATLITPERDVLGDVEAKYGCPKAFVGYVSPHLFSFTDKDWKLCALFVETYARRRKEC